MPQLAIRRDTPHQDGLNNSDQTVSKCRAHGTSELAVLTSPSRVYAPGSDHAVARPPESQLDICSLATHRAKLANTSKKRKTASM
jgi:hypothetical protein